MGAEESRPAGARGADADLLGGALKGWGVPAEWQGAPPQPTPAADDDLRVSADVLRQAGATRITVLILARVAKDR